MKLFYYFKSYIYNFYFKLTKPELVFILNLAIYFYFKFIAAVPVNGLVVTIQLSAALFATIVIYISEKKFMHRLLLNAVTISMLYLWIYSICPVTPEASFDYKNSETVCLCIINILISLVAAGVAVNEHRFSAILLVQSLIALTLFFHDYNLAYFCCSYIISLTLGTIQYYLLNRATVTKKYAYIFGGSLALSIGLFLTNELLLDNLFGDYIQFYNFYERFLVLSSIANAAWLLAQSSFTLGAALNAIGVNGFELEVDYAQKANSQPVAGSKNALNVTQLYMKNGPEPSALKAIKNGRGGLSTSAINLLSISAATSPSWWAAAVSTIWPYKPSDSIWTRSSELGSSAQIAKNDVVAIDIKESQNSRYVVNDDSLNKQLSTILNVDQKTVTLDNIKEGEPSSVVTALQNKNYVTYKLVEGEKKVLLLNEFNAVYESDKCVRQFLGNSTARSILDSPTYLSYINTNGGALEKTLGLRYYSTCCRTQPLADWEASKQDALTNDFHLMIHKATLQDIQVLKLKYPIGSIKGTANHYVIVIKDKEHALLFVLTTSRRVPKDESTYNPEMLETCVIRNKKTDELFVRARYVSEETVQRCKKVGAVQNIAPTVIRLKSRYVEDSTLFESVPEPERAQKWLEANLSNFKREAHIVVDYSTIDKNIKFWEVKKNY
jgi:hypothetical protein